MRVICRGVMTDTMIPLLIGAIASRSERRDALDVIAARSTFRNCAVGGRWCHKNGLGMVSTVSVIVAVIHIYSAFLLEPQLDI